MRVSHCCTPRHGARAGGASAASARVSSTVSFAGIAHRRRLSSSSTSTPVPVVVARSSSSSSSPTSPTTPVTPVTDAEEEANNKRWQESGGGAGSSDAWRWTLNWDEILPGKVFVGSCPRSAFDVSELVKGTGATAILCLQSDLCLEALQIDWRGVTGRADELGVLHVRAAVRDFDHGDQAFMLPEAVRLLSSLLELGETVYVHCTAGINRASLAVVGYLTFAKGQSLERALGTVRSRRAQANPYVDCWRTVRSKALEGKGEEVAARAKARYLRRNACERLGGGESDSNSSSTSTTMVTASADECDVLMTGDDDESDDGGEGRGLRDWVAAEADLLREATGRQVECTMTLARSLKKRGERRARAAAEEGAARVAAAEAEAAAAKRELEAARGQVAALAAALDEAAAASGAISSSKSAVSSGLSAGPSRLAAAGLNGGGNGSSSSSFFFFFFFFFSFSLSVARTGSVGGARRGGRAPGRGRAGGCGGRSGGCGRREVKRGMNWLVFFFLSFFNFFFFSFRKSFFMYFAVVVVRGDK